MVSYIFWAEVQSVSVSLMCRSVWRNIGLFCSSDFLVWPGTVLKMSNNYFMDENKWVSHQLLFFYSPEGVEYNQKNDVNFFAHMFIP